MARQHGLRGTRILHDIGRLEQARDNHDPLRASREDLRKVVQLDSADAKDWERGGDVRRPNAVKADRDILRLRGRGEERTEANVIRAFRGRASCLINAVGRLADEASPSDLSRLRDGQVVLAHVHTFSADVARDLRVVVNHERYVCLRGNAVQFKCEPIDLTQASPFCSQLNDVDATCDHPGGNMDSVARLDITEVKDTVEMAIDQRFQRVEFTLVSEAALEWKPEPSVVY